MQAVHNEVLQHELTKYPFIVVQVSYFSEKKKNMCHLFPVYCGYFCVDNSIYISAGQEAAVFTSLYGTFT